MAVVANTRLLILLEAYFFIAVILLSCYGTMLYFSCDTLFIN